MTGTSRPVPFTHSVDEEGGFLEKTAIERDARDLCRGVLVNLFGYLLRFAYPVLTWVVIYLYGKETFGAFLAAQAILLFAMRICLAGFDKGILWWIPRQPAGEERQGLLPVLLLVAATSSVAMAAVALFLAPQLAAWSDAPDAAPGLRWMAVGLIPMALTEVIVGAALGKRRMEAQVIVKEGLGSVSLMGAAVCFYHLGWRTSGLPLAFTLSTAAGLAGALWVFRRSFAGSSWPRGDRRLPRPLVRYSLPMWFAEMANSALLRLDVVLLAWLTDPGTVGLYGAVAQLGNAIRSVRRAFDPIVTAIISQIGASRDAARLIAGFSRATSLVLTFQLPIFAFLLVLAPWTMGLLGEGYEAAGPAALALCGFWVLNGLTGLNGLVVIGYGRSDLALVDVFITMAIEGVLLWQLVPGHGLMGAVIAVGLAYTAQNAIQVVQARSITGIWVYDRNVLWAIGVGVAAVAAMGIGWFALLPFALGIARIGSLAIFLAVFGTGLYRLYRNGQLTIS